MSKVAVIGNTARAIGAVCASDLALSGHDVHFTVFPEQGDLLSELRKAGGFTVDGGAEHLISRKTGFARLSRICETTGEALKGAASLGVRPMFDPPKELLEPYFFDFAGDLYGRKIEVELCHFLRPELKFDSLAALRAQMAEDCAEAKTLLG